MAHCKLGEIALFRAVLLLVLSSGRLVCVTEQQRENLQEKSRMPTLLIHWTRYLTLMKPFSKAMPVNDEPCSLVEYHHLSNRKWRKVRTTILNEYKWNYGKWRRDNSIPETLKSTNMKLHNCSSDIKLVIWEKKKIKTKQTVAYP